MLSLVHFLPHFQKLFRQKISLFVLIEFTFQFYSFHQVLSQRSIVIDDCIIKDFHGREINPNSLVDLIVDRFISIQEVFLYTKYARSFFLV